MPLTESERKLRSTIAAHESWANTPDRASRTAPARRALEQRFLTLADGDPVKAEHLRKAHYARMALKSAQSRRRAKESLQAATDAEAELQSLGDK